MARKNLILEKPLSELPPVWPFYSGKIPTKLMIKVERKRLAQKPGITAKNLIIDWAEKYVNEGKK